MDATAEASATVVNALGLGLPTLLLHFGAVLVLWGLGLLVYMAVTPFHEQRLLRAGNAAAATVLGGAMVALAIPLAALLATTGALLGILVWGAVAVILQLVTVSVASLLLRSLRGMIEAGQMAAAIPLVAAQIAIGLLNAGVMVPV